MHTTTQDDPANDAVALSRPRPENLVPPETLSICFGGGDFLRIGNALLKRLVDWCGLLPSERVLDVGCGAGRAAVPLTAYLSDHGVYEGMDTYPFGVDWARDAITPHFPNFHFRFVDVFNNLYNPAAPVRAADFVFPYPDAAFDLALLNSVFTHMLPEDVLGYLGQIARVLDTGGRMYCTWFLMNDDARAHLAANSDRQVSMQHGYGSFYVHNPEDPEEAVGYEERFARAMLQRQGFAVDMVSLGNWCGRKSAHYQDIVVARKA